MAKIVFHREAINDLSNTWEYTYDNWSENQADIYYQTLKIACNAILENPDVGRKYHQISNNLLGLKIRKHIIFYHILEDEKIEVIRILHESMDLKNRLSD